MQVVWTFVLAFVLVTGVLAPVQGQLNPRNYPAGTFSQTPQLREYDGDAIAANEGDTAASRQEAEANSQPGQAPVVDEPNSAPAPRQNAPSTQGAPNDVKTTIQYHPLPLVMGQIRLGVEASVGPRTSISVTGGIGFADRASYYTTFETVYEEFDGVVTNQTPSSFNAYFDVQPRFYLSEQVQHGVYVGVLAAYRYLELTYEDLVTQTVNNVPVVEDVIVEQSALDLGVLIGAQGVYGRFVIGGNVGPYVVLPLSSTGSAELTGGSDEPLTFFGQPFRRSVSGRVAGYIGFRF